MTKYAVFHQIDISKSGRRKKPTLKVKVSNYKLFLQAFLKIQVIQYTTLYANLECNETTAKSSEYDCTMYNVHTSHIYVLYMN